VQLVAGLTHIFACYLVKIDRPKEAGTKPDQGRGKMGKPWGFDWCLASHRRRLMVECSSRTVWPTFLLAIIIYRPAYQGRDKAKQTIYPAISAFLGPGPDSTLPGKRKKPDGDSSPPGLR